MSPTGKYFGPWQARVIEDESDVIIWEKGRRTGGTLAVSYKAVRGIGADQFPRVTFSSSNLGNARDFITYCATWAKILDIAAQDLGEVFIDKENDIKGFMIEFSGNRRIIAVSSNPTAVRGKDGLIILDEFAFHANALEMWKAAKPATMWGYPIIILSTHNGKSSLFWKFLERAKQGKLKWSVHSTPIQLAVEEGLLDKIKGRRTNKEEREDWLRKLEEEAANELVWQEEYCCNPIDEKTSYFPYTLIESCESESTLWDTEGDFPADEKVEGVLYLGNDIGRHKHLAVIWIDEKLGDVLYTRKIITMDNMSFAEQEERLFAWLQHPKMIKACLDQTGMGEGPTERAKARFGSYRVEGVRFSGASKQEMAERLRRELEDKKKILPASAVIRESFHSIRKFVTAGGNIRFDAATTDETGHADHFWAGALASEAASESASAPVRIMTSGARDTATMTRSY